MTALTINAKTLSLAAAVGAVLGLIPIPDAVAANLPVFDKVIHGSIELNNKNPTYLHINGRGHNNVLQWHSFDIAADHTVDFSNGNFLNLVNDRKASRIDGVLRGHGSSVFIVNPRGITFGRESIIDVGSLGLSTAQPTKAMLEKFVNSPTNIDGAQFSLSQAKGMGKVRLLGEINTQNLIIDAGQIIIKDLHSLVDENQQPLNKQNVTLQSSVNRIDVGFGDATAEEANQLQEKILGDRNDIVSHQGEIALSSAEEAQARLAYDPNGKYWLTDNIELTESLADNFSGTLDGVGNHVKFDIQSDGSSNVGLFGTLNGAEIKNLAMTDSTLDLS